MARLGAHMGRKVRTSRGGGGEEEGPSKNIGMHMERGCTPVGGAHTSKGATCLFLNYK
jgi:hypothetical protein